MAGNGGWADTVGSLGFGNKEPNLTTVRILRRAAGKDQMLKW